MDCIACRSMSAGGGIDAVAVGCMRRTQDKQNNHLVVRNPGPLVQQTATTTTTQQIYNNKKNKLYTTRDHLSTTRGEIIFFVFCFFFWYVCISFLYGSGVCVTCSLRDRRPDTESRVHFNTGRRISRRPSSDPRGGSAPGAQAGGDVTRYKLQSHNFHRTPTYI